MIKKTVNNQDIYATPESRLIATVIDIVITTPILILAARLFGFDVVFIANEVYYGTPTPEVATQRKIIDFIFNVILIAYSVYFLTNKSMATPGKKIMNIYVADVNGKKLSIGRVILRFFGSVICSMILGAGFVPILFTKERTGLHDLMAGSRVYKNNK